MVLGASNTVRSPGKTENRRVTAGEPAASAPNFGPWLGTPLLSRHSSPNVLPSPHLPAITRFREPREPHVSTTQPASPTICSSVSRKPVPDSPSVAVWWTQSVLVLGQSRVLGQSMSSAQNTDNVGHRQCQEARAQLPPGLPGGTAYCQVCNQLGLMVRALTPESCPLHYVEVILMQ